MNIRDKKDLTNSQLAQELLISADSMSPTRNICWIKCNKLGNKTLKLNFANTVEKTIKVRWREKPLTLKSTYNTIKEISFNVTNLFSVTKIFREAQSGIHFITKAFYSIITSPSIRRLYFPSSSRPIKTS